MNTLLSIFSGGLWLIPLLTLTGTAIFGYKGYKASKSNSTQQTPSGTKDNTGNVPFYKTGFGILSILCFLATIAIVLLMVGDR